MGSTSYNQTPSSSVSTLPPTRWDVFLSFRGKDTRYHFTDHLYTALNRIFISTFRDTDELSSGEVISDALPQAIHESKTYIVVFSETYASSHWCLDELVEIYNYHKTMKRLVIPVFYKINASVVRQQIGSFEEAFQKLQIRYEMEKVNKWRQTLTAVGDFSGYHISENRSEACIINEIVDRILFEINPKTLDVPKYAVGLDSRVEDITALFSSDANGFIRIGIHGMGGVGKTTLAKAVYNQHYRHFQGCCFLKNVREESATGKGLICLQRQLINNVLKRKDIIVDNVDHGIELIRARICSSKVLIVIDDLDNQESLKFLEGPFALGSIIIITTRNEDLLDSLKVEVRYKVNELGDPESNQLFSQHAFGDSIISDTLKDLSKEILERAGGLPLALEVFGMKLINKPEEGWKCFIDTMKRVSIKDVKEKLMISFKALEMDHLQDIFLDIACFFIGRKEEEVVKIMETCYKLVDYNIDFLNKRSLLTIDSRDKLLRMHHQLRDMGREIARNNSPREPGKHSRLWVSEDICNVLKKHKGTEAIEGIIPHNHYYQDALKGVSFRTETFRRMNILRFLYLEDVNLTGSFEQTLEDLRWLCWYRCPLKCFPSSFYPQQLVVLELPHSKMRTMWEPNVVSPVFEKLKTLNMSYSLDLTTTPDFSKLSCLETLNLEGCTSLEEVHLSIGSLVRLVSLNLSGCVKLRSLPDTIFNLRALEVLCIANCSSLEALPEELGSIAELPSSLKWIKADGCTSMGRLPNLSNLEQLEKLDLTGCSYLKEIQGLKELTSIRILHLGGCNSSLLAYTFEERFFQIYSGFGHRIKIYIGKAEFPEWISRSTNFGSTMSLDLLPNVSHNFLGMILCFKHLGDKKTYKINCSVKTTTSDFIWSDDTHYSPDNYESLMIIVPKIIFSVTDGDQKIELNANAEVYGIHLLSKNECESITVNVEDERSYPSKRLKHSESDKN